jgi:uncharacterized membrane protein YbaN (DUF454 family)
MGSRRHPPASSVLPPGESDSPLLRGVLFAAGSLCFVLAVLGVFLPLLPATPLFIAAAACFARAYRPLHQWMLDHRWLGPMLREWYRHRSLPYRTKLVAIATMLVSFGVSITFFVRPGWLKIALALCALALATWLYRIPSRDGPGRAGDTSPPSA